MAAPVVGVVATRVDADVVISIVTAAAAVVVVAAHLLSLLKSLFSRNNRPFY
jgi:hypothetical protein